MAFFSDNRGSLRAEAGASGKSPVAQSQAQADGRRSQHASQADVVGRSSPGSEPFHDGATQQKSSQQSQGADAGRNISRAAGGGLWEVSSLVDSVSATLKDTVSMSERPAPVTMRGAGARLSNPPTPGVPLLATRNTPLSTLNPLQNRRGQRRQVHGVCSRIRRYERPASQKFCPLPTRVADPASIHTRACQWGGPAPDSTAYEILNPNP